MAYLGEPIFWVAVKTRIMKYCVRMMACCFLAVGLVFVSGARVRESKLLDHNWKFAFGYEVLPSVWQQVELPHTWNGTDAAYGKTDYYRGLGIYEKSIFVDKHWAGKRLFLKFDGAAMTTHVFINGKLVGEHKGGYTAFIFEITKYVIFDANNIIQVNVNNAPDLDLMPLIGDYNFYGGIYRDVHLIVTNALNISLGDYASAGVYLTQEKVSKTLARVNAKILVDNGVGVNTNCKVRVRVYEGMQSIVEKILDVTAGALSKNVADIPFEIVNPRLWNGRRDPFLYSVKVSILQNGALVDEVTQPLGLRYFAVDPNKGFFLNGSHLQLKGVCRHQDRSEKANALSDADEEEDMSILLEMGANAIRLSHYPPAPYFMDLLDKDGIVGWCEIPFVGPGGYRYPGFTNTAAFKENGKQQLLEMIRQNYNRPSICFWGLYNELKMDGDSPFGYVKELNDLAKQEDPGRLTTCANMTGIQNDITDLIGWNLYYGWYGGAFRGAGEWNDTMHARYPNFKICVSEYGAGGSVYQHQDSLLPTDPASRWHPEEWQSAFHEANWDVYNRRPFIWGTFIWNLFDFGAAMRNEGDRAGRNDKGLVTYDRKIKKDAFWFYKANWNKEEPVLYITDRRFTTRADSNVMVKVYSNLDTVELSVNDVPQGASTGYNATFLWDKVKLQRGENRILARAVKDGKYFTDTCNWFLE